MRRNEHLDWVNALNEHAKSSGYREHLLRQAISEAKETLGEERTKQIIAEELER